MDTRHVKSAVVSLALISLLGIAAGRSTQAGARSQRDNAINNGPAQECWTSFPDPVFNASRHGLGDIAAVTASDIWAVGNYIDYGGALIMHWDGAAWSVVSSPSTGNKRDVLVAAAAISHDDVWAVGWSLIGFAGIKSILQPLTEHWDGTRWTIVPSPSTGGGSLYGVSAASADDVWAVGYFQLAKGNDGKTILHWDGRAWSEVQFSEPAGYDHLLAVAAISANDVWAVGNQMLHYDGRSWNDTGMRIAGELQGISALGPDDIWAVGYEMSHRLTMHWDGRQWARVPVPDPSPGVFDSLEDVAAVGHDDVWAVGPDSLLVHWDGTNWTKVPNPVGTEHNGFNGVASVDGSLWVVGSTLLQGTGVPDRALLLRHMDGPCPPSPSPTARVRLNPPILLPDTPSRTFTETGKTVTGPFLQYWEEHGGLPQQGFPISDVMGEVSDLNGRLYTVQYFERAVFEYHPEYKGTAYEVLLSQLGTFEYKKKYPGGAPNQQPNDSPGSVVFPQTGKRLGGKFLDYWKTHGGLAQQGYPISDELTEVSPVDGKRYRMQYFERAVFELHPENAAPYDVLLSLLGRLRWNEPN